MVVRRGDNLPSGTPPRPLWGSMTGDFDEMEINGVQGFGSRRRKTPLSSGGCSGSSELEFFPVWKGSWSGKEGDKRKHSPHNFHGWTSRDPVAKGGA